MYPADQIRARKTTQHLAKRATHLSSSLLTLFWMSYICCYALPMCSQMWQPLRKQWRDAQEGREKVMDGKCLKALIAAIMECGVTLNVWGKADGDGSGSGCYDWTCLMGKGKHMLLKSLPDKLQGIVFDNTPDTVIGLWKVSCCLDRLRQPTQLTH